jgi:tetratricopeptide (TPR) repeat protein
MLFLAVSLAQALSLPVAIEPCSSIMFARNRPGQPMIGVVVPPDGAKAVCRVDTLVHIDGQSEAIDVACTGEGDSASVRRNARRRAESVRFTRQTNTCVQSRCFGFPDGGGASPTAATDEICRVAPSADSFTAGFQNYRLLLTVGEAQGARRDREREAAVVSLTQALDTPGITRVETRLLLDNRADLLVALERLEEAGADWRQIIDLLEQDGQSALGFQMRLALVATNGLSAPEQADYWLDFAGSPDAAAPEIAAHTARALGLADRYAEAAPYLNRAFAQMPQRYFRPQETATPMERLWADAAPVFRRAARNRSLGEAERSTAAILRGWAVSRSRPYEEAVRIWADVISDGMLPEADALLLHSWIGMGDHFTDRSAYAARQWQVIAESTERIPAANGLAAAHLAALAGDYEGGFEYAIGAYRNAPEDRAAGSTLAIYVRELGSERIEAALAEP